MVPEIVGSGEGEVRRKSGARNERGRHSLRGTKVALLP
jgi:hypothetical protein